MNTRGRSVGVAARRPPRRRTPVAPVSVCESRDPPRELSPERARETARVRYARAVSEDQPPTTCAIRSSAPRYGIGKASTLHENDTGDGGGRNADKTGNTWTYLYIGPPAPDHSPHLSCDSDWRRSRTPLARESPSISFSRQLSRVGVRTLAASRLSLSSVRLPGMGASGLAFCRGNIQDCGHARIDCQAQRGDQAQRPAQVGLYVCTRAGSVSAWSHRCCHG